MNDTIVFIFAGFGIIYGIRILLVKHNERARTRKSNLLDISDFLLKSTFLLAAASLVYLLIDFFINKREQSQLFIIIVISLVLYRLGSYCFSKRRIEKDYSE